MAIDKPTGPAFLCAFPYWSEKTRDCCKVLAEHGFRIMMDSGAFTAHRAGNVIDLDQYCEALERDRSWLWRYVALDVVGRIKGTRDNLAAMRSRGLDPTPVLVVTEHVDSAPEFCSAAGNICVTGGVSQDPGYHRARLNAVRERLPPETWIHSLGFSRWPHLLSLGADSVDGSSWNQAQRWGWILVGPLHNTTKVNVKQLRKTPWAEWPPAVRTALIKNGVTPEQWTTRGANGAASVIQILTCATFWQRAFFAQRREITTVFAFGNEGILQNLLAVGAHVTNDGVAPDAAILKSVAMMRDEPLAGPTFQRLAKQAAHNYRERSCPRPTPSSPSSSASSGTPATG